MNQLGYDSLLIRVFNSNQDEVFEGITRFKFIHSEKASDQSEIVIETQDLTLVDHPDLQEGKQLIIVWSMLVSNKTQKRRMWIWEIKADFTENGLELKITMFSKIAYLAMRHRKNPWNDSTLFSMMEQMGAEADMVVGLEGFEEEFEGGLPSNPDGGDIEKESSLVRIGGPTQADFDSEQAQFIVPRDQTRNLQTQILFKTHESMPQGNLSDLEQLDKVTKQEGIENLVIDGHDDKLIIRKRNLNQTPYRRYEYRAEPGNVIRFTPESHNMEKKDDAVAWSMNGWDPETGEYLQTKVNIDQQEGGVLGEMVDYSLEDAIRQKWAKESSTKAGQTVMIDGLFSGLYQEEDENGQPIYKKLTEEQMKNGLGIATYVKKGTKPQNFDLETKQYFQAIDETGIEFRAQFAVDMNRPIDSLETTPEDLGGAGANNRAQSDLELNESELKVVGDPELVSAKVITILGVGKKYNGNYYVASVSHELDPVNGYVCILKLWRNGFNKIGGEIVTRFEAKSLGLNVNKKQIPRDGTEQLIEVVEIND